MLLAIDGTIATPMHNRPAAGNASDLRLAQALVQAVIRCDSDLAIRRSAASC